MEFEDLKRIFGNDNETFNDIIGQDGIKDQLRSAILMKRHIIIVGQPGIGKTTLAKSIAKSLPEVEVNACGFNCMPDTPFCPSCKSGKISGKKKISGKERFIRIQGSPDLTVEDILGDIDPIKALEYGPLSTEAFTPGKIFKANNGVLFFDEINRCSEKLQNALLQVLQERIATIGSYDVDFPADFIFIGTMNPEDSATEPLSTVFLDRFDLVYMDYPENNATEVEITKRYGRSIGVTFDSKLLELTILFVRLLRQSDKLQRHPGVRASLGLYERAQSNAFIKKRDHVIFNDIKDAVVSVISHRIELKPSIKYLETPEDFIRKEFTDFVKQNPEIGEDRGDDP